ncbi:MAG: LuxR C-terminal-related transcriptional regulator [Planctomycetota bacterium]
MSTLGAAGESRVTADRALSALASASSPELSRQERMDRLARGVCDAVHADWAVWRLTDGDGGSMGEGSASGESAPPGVRLPEPSPPENVARSRNDHDAAATWREAPPNGHDIDNDHDETGGTLPPATDGHGPGPAMGCLVELDPSTTVWLACYRDRRRPGFSHHDAEVLGRVQHIGAALLRSEPGGRGDDPRVQKLPTRLRQTLSGLLAGQSEKQVAADLGLSPHTVHNYVRQLYRRFEVSSRGELLSLFVTRPAPKTDVHLGEGI